MFFLLACIDVSTLTDAPPLDDTGDTEAPAEPTWGYDGDEAPEHWGELSEEWAACSEGEQQSPIDIDPSLAAWNGTPPPVLAWGTTTLQAYNPGHYIRYEVDDGSTLTWGGETYDLVQFHFHARSEHTLYGEHTDMEVHFVHEARSDTKRLAVVALLINGDPVDSTGGLFGAAGDLQLRDALALPESEETTDLGGSVDLSQLDYSGAGFMHYMGSLTTPPCTEGVPFFILGSVPTILTEDVQSFQTVYDHNFRPTQLLNGRVYEVLSAGE